MLKQLRDDRNPLNLLLPIMIISKYRPTIKTVFSIFKSDYLYVGPKFIYIFVHIGLIFLCFKNIFRNRENCYTVVYEHILFSYS